MWSPGWFCVKMLICFQDKMSFVHLGHSSGVSSICYLVHLKGITIAAKNMEVGPHVWYLHDNDNVCSNLQLERSSRGPVQCTFKLVLFCSTLISIHEACHGTWEMRQCHNRTGSRDWPSQFINLLLTQECRYWSDIHIQNSTQTLQPGKEWTYIKLLVKLLGSRDNVM